MKTSRLVLSILLGATSMPALAYVGPGAGLTLVGALWGLVLAVAAALTFVIAWPLRQWRKRVNAARHGGDADSDGARDDRPRSE